MREGEEGGGPGVPVGVPATTCPRIQQKLSCERNSVQGNKSGVAYIGSEVQTSFGVMNVTIHDGQNRPNRYFFCHPLSKRRVFD